MSSCLYCSESQIHCNPSSDFNWKRASRTHVYAETIELLWPPYCVADADVIFLPCGLFNIWPPCIAGCGHIHFHPVVSSFFFFFYFLVYSQRLGIGCLPYFNTWCGLSVNLECMSEMCCTRLAENTRRKMTQKLAIWAPSHNFVGLYLCK